MRRFSHRTILYPIVLVTSSLVGSVCCLAQPGQVAVPSVEELKAARFEDTTAPNHVMLIEQADISAAIASCREYARGSSMLQQYHEPPLTRSATGIGIFR